jgi:hypothetical protein
LANCVKKTTNLVEIAFKNKLVQKICFKRIAKLPKNSPKKTINEHLYLLALPIGKKLCICARFGLGDKNLAHSVGQCGDNKCSHDENFHMDVIRAFHIHILFHSNKIDTSSCKFSLHALAKGWVRGEGERENPNPCHVLLLKIQTW